MYFPPLITAPPQGPKLQSWESPWTALFFMPLRSSLHFANPQHLPPLYVPLNWPGSNPHSLSHRQNWNISAFSHSTEQSLSNLARKMQLPLSLLAFPRVLFSWLPASSLGYHSTVYWDILPLPPLLMWVYCSTPLIFLVHPLQFPPPRPPR